VAGLQSPQRLLTGIYADLLRLTPVRQGGTFTLQPARTEARRRGAYFTPVPIAAEVTRRALAGGPGRPRVLDPAMGTGVFLLEAARQIAGDGDRASVAESCLYGIDLDPIAVRVAVLSIWLETGARPEVLHQHLVQGDALAEEVSVPEVDVVLGNPPWGKGYSWEERERLRERFPDVMASSFDTAKLFVDLGSRWTRGTLGMVLPQAFAAQERHADVRGVLLQRLAPRASFDLGDAFPDAAAPACALVFSQKPGSATTEVGGEPLPATAWTDSGFPLRRDDIVSVLRRVQLEHPSIGEVGASLRVRDVGLNYNRASVSRRSLYSAADPEHALDRPLYRGRDFARYTSIDRGGWLRHDAEDMLLPGESLSYDAGTAALPAKIVLRQTADRIIATLDRTRMVMGRSVIAVVVLQPDLLVPILALLNSGPVTAFYRALSGERGRILPQVKVARLRALPLPSLDDHHAVWAQLGWWGQRLLDRNGQDPRAEAEVDRLVARVYDLSAPEARLVGQRS
jgi:predicted RNA methylase